MGSLAPLFFGQYFSFDFASFCSRESLNNFRGSSVEKGVLGCAASCAARRAVRPARLPTHSRSDLCSRHSFPDFPEASRVFTLHHPVKAMKQARPPIVLFANSFFR